jgi:hypothetical protein
MKVSPINLFLKLKLDKINLLYLYLSVKRSHHVRREDLEIPMLIQKEKNIDRWIL